MIQYWKKDLSWFEQTPTSPASLNYKIGEVMLHSINCKANVESVNPTTGEYRIVLEGTLDQMDPETT